MTDASALVATMPFAVSSGVQIDAATAEEVRGGIDWAPERCTTGGLMHGGALGRGKRVALVTQTQAVITG